MTSRRPRRRLGAAPLVLTAVVASALTVSAQPAAASTSTVLRDRVNSALRGSTASVHGVQVVVSGLGTVVSRSGTTSLKPASTQKSYVGFTALRRLGAGRRMSTYVLATGTYSSGTLRGHLVLKGTGDPTLTTTHLTAMARALRAKGIVRVTGGLYADDTYFDRKRRADGWKTSFVPVESGPLSALVVNRNRWRTDATYITEPAVPNADRFRAALRSAGVTVAKGTHLGHPAAGSRIMVNHLSTTVGVMVRSMLKDSDNMTAELLLKRLGKEVGAGGSTAAGAAVVRAQMQSLGVPVGVFADGSGLSTLDRQTPAGEVALLRAAGQTSVASTFKSSLSRACVDGTLENRMCGTAASGRVWAKTGTLDHVRVLAGYTTTRSGRTVWFSFMLSGCDSGLSCRNAIDRAVVALAGFTG